MQGWNEIMHGGKLPKDVIVQQWDQPQAATQAARAGNDVVVSQTTWTYFDYPYEATPLRKVYEAEPIPADLTPGKANTSGCAGTNVDGVDSRRRDRR
jgi:hexosaminidase